MSSIAQKIATSSTSLEAATRAGDFIELARFIAARSAMDPTDARAAREALAPRVQQILKSATDAGSTGNMSALAPYQQLATGFLEGLRQISLFDAALPFMKRVPSHVHVVTVTAAASGAAVGEGMAKPLTSMTVAGSDMTPRKAVAMVAATAELFKLSAGASNLFNAELRGAVALATDADFLATLYASVTPTASAGSTTANTLTDLGALLSALTLGAGSRVFVAMSPSNLAKLMTKVSSGSGTAYPLLRLDGGEWLGGITVIPTTAVPSGGIIAFDASGIVAASEALELRASGQADIQMNSTPDSPAGASTVTRSLWQQNMRALLAERYYSFVIARSGAVSAISGAAY